VPPTTSGKRDAFSYSALAPLRRHGPRYFGACNNVARTDGVRDFRSDLSVELKVSDMQYAVEQQPEVIGILWQEYLQTAIAFRFALLS
jgi:hypothetical protein